MGAYATSSIIPLAIGKPNLGMNELARVDMGIFFNMLEFSSKKELDLLNKAFFLRYYSLSFKADFY